MIGGIQDFAHLRGCLPHGLLDMDKKDWLLTVLALLLARPPAAGLFGFRYDARCDLRGLCTSKAALCIRTGLRDPVFWRTLHPSAPQFPTSPYQGSLQKQILILHCELLANSRIFREFRGGKLRGIS